MGLSVKAWPRDFVGLGLHYAFLAFDDGVVAPQRIAAGLLRGQDSGLHAYRAVQQTDVPEDLSELLP